MQHNNHYKSICGLDGHTEVPQAWLHRTEVKPKKFYRGGGNKKQISLPSSLKRSKSGILSLADSVQESVKPCNKKAASGLSLPSSSKLSQQLKSVQKQSVSGKSLPPGSVCNQSVVTQDRTCRSTLPPGSKKGDGFCLSLPPGSESGKKRKAHVLEDTPQNRTWNCPDLRSVKTKPCGGNAAFLVVNMKFGVLRALIITRKDDGLT